MTLLVSDQTARENFTMRMCVQSVESAYAAAGRGNLDLIERRVVGVNDGGARLHSLAAADIRIWSHTRSRAEALVTEFPDGPGMRAWDSVQEAVPDAEIVVTVTTSKTPVLEGTWLAPGSHVNSIGAHHPDRREVDTATIVGSTVFVDTLASTTAEKGELLPIAEGRISWENCAPSWVRSSAARRCGREAATSGRSLRRVAPPSRRSGCSRYGAVGP